MIEFDYWVHLPQCFGLEGSVTCQVSQSANGQGKVFCGVASWVTKYSNSKAQMPQRKTYYLYLDPPPQKSCQRWTIYTDHRWLTRPFVSVPCGHEHITRVLLWLLPKAPRKKPFQEQFWTLSRDSPRSPCLFSSSNSIHPSTPDSLILRQHNHNLRERFLTNLSRPIYPLWNLYTSKYHLRRQTLRLCLMPKLAWRRGLARLKSAISRLYIIFHNFDFSRIFGDDASGNDVEVFL